MKTFHFSPAELAKAPTGEVNSNRVWQESVQKRQYDEIEIRRHSFLGALKIRIGVSSKSADSQTNKWDLMKLPERSQTTYILWSEVMTQLNCVKFNETNVEHSHNDIKNCHCAHDIIVVHK